MDCLSAANDREALLPLLALIKTFEGCRLTPYLCPAGILTCGWGATGAGVFPGVVWTQDQANLRLNRDAALFLTGTKALCPDLYGARLGAIADFSYNLGLGKLRSSTLRKRLNNGEFDKAVDELRRWNKAAGRILPGLVRRREAEILLLLSA